jgi:hypothetical protein
LNHRDDNILGAVRDFGVKVNDTVLGICWLRFNPNRFIAVTNLGAVRIVDASYAISSEFIPDSITPDLEVVQSFKRTEKLTCVHLNSQDQLGLSCGGDECGVRLFDMSTGKTVRTFKRAHEQPINIARFSFDSPWLFSSSSFDKSVKIWDTRVGRGTSERALYQVKGENQCVTLAFSPDDQYLLVSAVDNDVKSYCVADGRLHTEIKIEKSGRRSNYTRAYYSDGGRCVISGSSEESLVRINSSSNGEPQHSIPLYDGSPSSLLYIQSLRGSQTRLGYYGVLVNNRDPAYPLRMLIVDAHGKVPLHRREDSDGRMTDQPETICASNWAVSHSNLDDRNNDMSLVQTREWTRDSWRLMSLALNSASISNKCLSASISNKCLITLVTSLGESLHECVQGRVLAAIAIARVPLLAILIKEGMQRLVFPNSLAVTPAMLQILIQYMYLDTYIPPTAPPHVVQGHTSNRIVEILLGLSVEDAKNAARVSQKLINNDYNETELSELMLSSDRSSLVPTLWAESNRWSSKLQKQPYGSVFSFCGSLVTKENVSSRICDEYKTCPFIDNHQDPRLCLTTWDPFAGPGLPLDDARVIHAANVSTQKKKDEKVISNSSSDKWETLFSSSSGASSSSSSSSSAIFERNENNSTNPHSNNNVSWDVTGSILTGNGNMSKLSSYPDNEEVRITRLLEGLAAAFQVAQIFSLPRVAHLAVSSSLDRLLSASAFSRLIRLAIMFGANVSSIIKSPTEYLWPLNLGKSSLELAVQAWSQANERGLSQTTTSETASAATAVIICAAHFALSNFARLEALGIFSATLHDAMADDHASNYALVETFLNHLIRVHENLVKPLPRDDIYDDNPILNLNVSKMKMGSITESGGGLPSPFRVYSHEADPLKRDFFSTKPSLLKSFGLVEGQFWTHSAILCGAGMKDGSGRMQTFMQLLGGCKAIDISLTTGIITDQTRDLPSTATYSFPLASSPPLPPFSVSNAAFSPTTSHSLSSSSFSFSSSSTSSNDPTSSCQGVWYKSSFSGIHHSAVNGDNISCGLTPETPRFVVSLVSVDAKNSMDRLVVASTNSVRISTAALSMLGTSPDEPQVEIDPPSLQDTASSSYESFDQQLPNDDIVSIPSFRRTPFLSPANLNRDDSTLQAVVNRAAIIVANTGHISLFDTWTQSHRVVLPAIQASADDVGTFVPVSKYGSAVLFESIPTELLQKQSASYNIATSASNKSTDTTIRHFHHLFYTPAPDGLYTWMPHSERFLRILVTTVVETPTERKYSFEWQRVTGGRIKAVIQPRVRYAHSACVLPLPDEEGGPVMILACGFSDDHRSLNDVSILSLTGNPHEQKRDEKNAREDDWARNLSFTWNDTPIVFGQPPIDKTNASLTPIHSVLSPHDSTRSDITRRSAVLYGGQGPTGVNLLHILTLTRALGGKYAVTWSCPQISPDSKIPCPRSYHSAVYAPAWKSMEDQSHSPLLDHSSFVIPGAIIVFGGHGAGRVTFRRSEKLAQWTKHHKELRKKAILSHVKACYQRGASDDEILKGIVVEEDNGEIEDEDEEDGLDEGDHDNDDEEDEDEEVEIEEDNDNVDNNEEDNNEGEHMLFDDADVLVGEEAQDGMIDTDFERFFDELEKGEDGGDDSLERKKLSVQDRNAKYTRAKIAISNFLKNFEQTELTIVNHDVDNVDVNIHTLFLSCSPPSAPLVTVNSSSVLCQQIRTKRRRGQDDCEKMVLTWLDVGVNRIEMIQELCFIQGLESFAVSNALIPAFFLAFASPESLNSSTFSKSTSVPRLSLMLNEVLFNDLANISDASVFEEMFHSLFGGIQRGRQALTISAVLTERFNSLMDGKSFYPIQAKARWEEPPMRYLEPLKAPVAHVPRSTLVEDFSKLVVDEVFKESQIDQQTSSTNVVSSSLLSSFADIEISNDGADESLDLEHLQQLSNGKITKHLVSHSWLLEARSSALKALLRRSSQHVDSNGRTRLCILENEVCEKSVEDDDILKEEEGEEESPRAAMHLVLKFLASDTLDPLTSPSLVMQVLEIAGKFAIGRLAELAESLLISVIDSSNVCGFLQFADTHCRIQSSDDDDTKSPPSLSSSSLSKTSAKPLQRGEALYNGCVSVLLREFSKGMSDELKDDFNALDVDLQERIREIFLTQAHAYEIGRTEKTI